MSGVTSEQYFDVSELVRHIPPGSLVRLPDGRVGVMGYGARVLLSKDVGVEVSLNAKLAILAYPITLALKMLAAIEALDNDGRPSERDIYDADYL